MYAGLKIVVVKQLAIHVPAALSAGGSDFECSHIHNLHEAEAPGAQPCTSIRLRDGLIYLSLI